LFFFKKKKSFQGNVLDEPTRQLLSSTLKEKGKTEDGERDDLEEKQRLSIFKRLGRKKSEAGLLSD